SESPASTGGRSGTGAATTATPWTSAWPLPALVLMIAVGRPGADVLQRDPSSPCRRWRRRVSPGTPMPAGLFAPRPVRWPGDLSGARALGRGSHRLPRGRRRRRDGVARWIRSNLFRRPVIPLAAALFLPGGRLIAAPRPVARASAWGSFVVGSAVSSTLWACYMLGIGLALGPVTGGNPLLCVPGRRAVPAVLTAGRSRLRGGSAARRPAPAPAPARRSQPTDLGRSSRRCRASRPRPGAGSRRAPPG
ncbi:hypothetical protein HBB16_06000, partial [Pseudonocardia sp. MCCB 268]|nr:hypothetical protein [Pseudonocardia cytotoxica]